MKRLSEITRQLALQSIQTLYNHTAYWMEQNDLTLIVNDYFDHMQAKAEGRLVELPCKVGDTAFVASVFSGKIAKHTVTAIKFDDEGCFLYMGGIYKPAQKVHFTREAAEKALKKELIP